MSEVPRVRCANCGALIPEGRHPAFAYHWRIGHADACVPPLTVERFGPPAALEVERGVTPSTGA